MCLPSQQSVVKTGKCRSSQLKGLIRMAAWAAEQMQTSYSLEVRTKAVKVPCKGAKNLNDFNDVHCQRFVELRTEAGRSWLVVRNTGPFLSTVYLQPFQQTNITGRGELLV